MFYGLRVEMEDAVMDSRLFDVFADTHSKQWPGRY
jgi:hypothetical protein